MEIELCTAIHLPQLTEIYNDVIRTSTAVYADQPVSLENRQTWLADRQSQGYPVWVAVAPGQVLGFATFGDFRGAWPGYRFTVEHSVHVHRAARGTGVGTRLMERLLHSAEQLGKHVVVGAVDADNLPSIRFHERLGFTGTARLPQVGFKFGRWLDLLFLVKILGPATNARPDPSRHPADRPSGH